MNLSTFWQHLKNFFFAFLLLFVWSLSFWTVKTLHAKKEPRKIPPTTRKCQPTKILPHHPSIRSLARKIRGPLFHRKFVEKNALISVSPKLPKAADIENFLKPFRQKMKAKMGKVLLVLKKKFTRRRPESTLGNLVADLCLARLRAEGLKVDLFITNLGGIRRNLPAGPLTLGNVYELLPFQNKIIVFKLKGKQLRRILELLVRKRGEPIAGARLTFNPKLKKLLDVWIGGRKLKLAQNYTLATSDYLSHTGWMSPVLKNHPFKNTGLFIRDAFLWGIKHLKKSPNPRIDGRVHPILRLR